MGAGAAIYFKFFFFFNDTATTEIYTLSLHDALPIYPPTDRDVLCLGVCGLHQDKEDRKSTRLNSSHQIISYAVFCLKKKKNIEDGRGRYVRVSKTGTAARQASVA